MPLMGKGGGAGGDLPSTHLGSKGQSWSKITAEYLEASIILLIYYTIYQINKQTD